ncbi:lytic transglycosylase domain-containing protein [Gammaproteobacteria bacterium]|nr:lytic transglycosylase domain-containing protein [Porticoccaceae bacterium]MDB4850643.1 lytic transglycosylase domain-containing protein [Gammaproteobacteria bacterium]
MSIKKIMHKDRHGAQVSIEFGEGGAASQLVEQFLGGMGVPAMQDIPQQHPGGPKGTDTVPAWLTPGEFVMNAEATRMFEPQIEEMNNAGRAVQRQQGGSIPEYKADGGSILEYHDDGGMAGSWVNENVLDAVLGVESNGNFNVVSPAGARGGYQIMPATAANPGYGVTGISPEEVLDPVKSREFARQYLVGLAKEYPERTQQEILQMYNAGPGRVLNANTANPLPQEALDYPGKIEAEMERLGGSYGVPTVEDASTVPTTADDVLESLKRTVPPKDDGRLFPKYDPVAAREEQAKLEAANRVNRTIAEGKDIQRKGEGYESMLNMFGKEVPSVNEELEAEITAIDKQRVLGQIPDNVAAGKIKRLRDQERINEIAREAAKNRVDSGVVEEVAELERQAKLLEDAGYTEDADALREKAAVLTNSITTKPKSKEPDGNSIDALYRAASAEQARIEAAKKDDPDAPPSAWDKVKDFFKEGFGTVLDKGALSEAATLYLGSRALGYDHEGSLNFVTKRYGKGIEDKLANANKAVGTHTPESITKYKDTGNLMDLKLLPKLTDQGKPAYFVDRDGTTYDLRTVKDEKGVVKHIDASGAVIDTTKMLTSSEFTQREKANKDRLRKLIESKKKTMTASNKAAGDDDFDADLLVDTEQVVEAMTNYFMSNGSNTTKAAGNIGYVIDGILKHRRNPNMKDISDRDLTELLLNKAVVRSVDKNVFEPDKGKKEISPAVSSSIIDEAIPNIAELDGPVLQGQLLSIIRKNGYLKLLPSEREGYIARSGGEHNGFLQYLKEGQASRDSKKWQPAWQALNDNLNKT